MNYRYAPDVRHIAADLIERHHSRLANTRITCLFITDEKVPEKKGRPMMGDVKKISGLSSFLAWNLENYTFTEPAYNPNFFCLLIPEEVWECLKLSQREALVDSLLLRCEVGEGKCSVQDPDFEGFYQELVRHGAWRDELQQLLRNINEHQIELPYQEEEAEQR